MKKVYKIKRNRWCFDSNRNQHHADLCMCESLDLARKLMYQIAIKEFEATPDYYGANLDESKAKFIEAKKDFANADEIKKVSKATDVESDILWFILNEQKRPIGFEIFLAYDFVCENEQDFSDQLTIKK